MIEMVECANPEPQNDKSSKDEPSLAKLETDSQFLLNTSQGMEAAE